MILFSVLLKRCETSYFIEMWVYVLTVIRLCRKLCYWSLFCSMPGPVQVCSTCHVSAFFTRVQYFLCRWVASRLLFLCPTKLFVLSKKMKIMITDTCFFSWKKSMCCCCNWFDRLKLINAPSLKKMHEKTRSFFGLDSRLGIGNSDFLPDFFC